MTERLPLSATSTDPFERALLGSVRRDHPGPHAMRRTAAALGLSTTAIASAASSALVAAGTSVAGTSAQGGAVVSLPWLALKAVSLGVLCGTVAVVGANAVTAPKPDVVHRPAATESLTAGSAAPNAARVPLPALLRESAPREHTDEIAAPRGARPTTVSATAGPATSRAIDERSPQLSPPLGDVPRAEPVPSDVLTLSPGPSIASVPAWISAADVAAKAPASAPVASSIGEEIASIDRARQLVRSGNARAALGELDRYERNWRNGVFGNEAVVLRVEASLANGDRAAAERAADGIMAARPHSHYAARVRAILGAPR